MNNRNILLTWNFHLPKLSLYSWNIHFIYIFSCLIVLFSRSAKNTFDLASVVFYLFIYLFFGFQFLLGITVTPRRNRRKWLCDFFGGGGGAGDGWVNRVHYGLYDFPGFNCNLLNKCKIKQNVDLMQKKYISYCNHTLQHSQKLNFY